MTYYIASIMFTLTVRTFRASYFRFLFLFYEITVSNIKDCRKVEGNV